MRRDSHEPVSHTQRHHAAEEFRRYVAIGGEITLVALGRNEQWRAQRTEGVNVLGKQRNHRLRRKILEALADDGSQHGGLVAEDENRAFARIDYFHQKRKYGAGGFGEIAVGSH
jgi:hypothetical protein